MFTSDYKNDMLASIKLPGVYAIFYKYHDQRGIIQINKPAASRRGIAGTNLFVQKASRKITPFLFE
jgi:hypothetical protein